MSSSFETLYIHSDVDPTSKEWIREYVDGKNELRDSLANQARKYVASGLNAEASVLSDIALNIPSRSEFYAHNHQAVLQAMLLNNPEAQAAHDAAVEQNQGMDAIRYSVKIKLATTEQAFGFPSELHDELSLISQNGPIEESEEAYSHAIDTFFDDRNFLEASISSMKLSQSYDNDHSKEAVDSLIEAIQLLMAEVQSNVDRSISAKNTARADTVLAYFGYQIDSIVQLLHQNPASIKVYADILEKALVVLRDVEPSSRVVKQGFELLA